MAPLPDRPAGRLTAFAVALLAVFGAAFGLGRVTAGDDGPPPPADPVSPLHAGHPHGGLGR